MKSSKILLILLALSTAGCMQNSFCMQSTRQGQEEQTDESAQKCIICLEAITNHKTLQCHHNEFCFNCIRRYFMEPGVKTCPLCRQEDLEFKNTVMRSITDRERTELEAARRRRLQQQMERNRAAAVAFRQRYLQQHQVPTQRPALRNLQYFAHNIRQDRTRRYNPGIIGRFR